MTFAEQIVGLIGADKYSIFLANCLSKAESKFNDELQAILGVLIAAWNNDPNKTDDDLRFFSEILSNSNRSNFNNHKDFINYVSESYGLINSKPPADASPIARKVWDIVHTPNFNCKKPWLIICSRISADLHSTSPKQMDFSFTQGQVVPFAPTPFPIETTFLTHPGFSQPASTLYPNQLPATDGRRILKAQRTIIPTATIPPRPASLPVISESSFIEIVEVAVQLPLDIQDKIDLAAQTSIGLVEYLEILIESLYTRRQRVKPGSDYDYFLDQLQNRLLQIKTNLSSTLPLLIKHFFNDIVEFTQRVINQISAEPVKAGVTKLLHDVIKETNASELLLRLLYFNFVLINSIYHMDNKSSTNVADVVRELVEDLQNVWNAADEALLDYDFNFEDIQELPEFDDDAPIDPQKITEFQKALTTQGLEVDLKKLSDIVCRTPAILGWPVETALTAVNMILDNPQQAQSLKTAAKPASHSRSSAPSSPA